MEAYLQNHELIAVPNIVSIACQESKKYDWNRGYGYQVFSNAKELGEHGTYFLMDTHNQNAFAHWIFENFVFLTMYWDIKKLYPGCKILLKERKGYKNLFLLGSGLKAEDIVDASQVDFQLQTLAKEPVIIQATKPNLVFFHPYLSLNNHETQEYGISAIQSFHRQIKQLGKEKTINILYLPRGEKENFQGLDRRYVIQDQCKRLVEENGGKVFYTDDNTDLMKQIEIVRSAKIILCDYGSNLWVNGFFSEDAHIVYLNIGWRQEEIFPYYAYLYHLIQSSNLSLHNMLATHQNDSVKPTLVYHSFPQIAETIYTLLNST